MCAVHVVGVAAGLIGELVRLRRAHRLLVRLEWQLHRAELSLWDGVRLVVVVRIVTVLQAVQSRGPGQRRAGYTLSTGTGSQTRGTIWSARVGEGGGG